MQAYLVTIVCKFDRDRAICLGEEAIFVPYSFNRIILTKRKTLNNNREVNGNMSVKCLMLK